MLVSRLLDTASGQDLAIFGFDGTLVDSEPLYAEQALLLLRRSGIEPEAGWLEHESPLDTWLRLAASSPGASDRLRGQLLAVGPIAPVVEAARQLARRGVTLVVASSNSPQLVRDWLAAKGLADLFPCVRASEAIAGGYRFTFRIDSRRDLLAVHQGPRILVHPARGQLTVL